MNKLLTLLFSATILVGCSPSSTPISDSVQKADKVLPKVESKVSEKVSVKQPRKVGVAMYTFHRRTLEEVAPLFKEWGVDAIGLSSTPLSSKFPKAKTGYKMPAEQREYLKKLLADNNLKIASYGVITPKNEADIIQACEFAKEMNIPLILTEALSDTIPLWEKYCEKYGLKMALHNHAVDRAKFNMYYNPNIVQGIIKNYKNIYACPDNGHWARSGIDALAGYKILNGKIAMIHFKDLESFDDLKAQPVPHGQGVLKVKEQLAELDKLCYDGYYMVEYEKNFNDNIADVRECVKFLKNN